MRAPLTPNEDRWCDWIATLEPHEQVTHDQSNWTSCTAFCGGIESEAARLRPLLMLCNIAIAGPASEAVGYDLILARREAIPERYRWLWDLAADLRRELGGLNDAP